MGAQNATIEEADVLVDLQPEQILHGERSSILCGTSKYLVDKTFPNCKMEFPIQCNNHHAAEAIAAKYAGQFERQWLEAGHY